MIADTERRIALVFILIISVLWTCCIRCCIYQTSGLSLDSFGNFFIHQMKKICRDLLKRKRVDIGGVPNLAPVTLLAYSGFVLTVVDDLIAAVC